MNVGMHRRRRAARQAGFTVLEMAVSVGVVGALALLAGTGYRDYAQWRACSHAEAQAETARQALRGFVLRNRRLPCPDLSALGDGAREGSGGACPAGAQVGWLPYETLGLPRPDRGERLRYAVSRPAGADLVAPSGSSAEDGNFDNGARLRASLATLAARTPGSDVPYLSDPNPERENCARVLSNPAFALVAALDDRDGDGTGRADDLARFDGLNRAMAASNALCIAAPGRPMDSRYDDVVASESADALLGWLATQTR
ncbi:type II secretion system protein [Stenotrophomonas sp. HITSZ_GD]|uniref:type II secretion system protein n=1 Tax=Stenotrophomonas sp. HITSZ_GD TaxID=3037248 RepID=UPI00240D1388|nr:type II secretion system protein [Stenotrophomonas sp. HITSZ_GD]MDG2526202.1 type II secretion system protein [Stenotrophomonas sp. HITSZ_GD]